MEDGKSQSVCKEGMYIMQRGGGARMWLGWTMHGRETKRSRQHPRTHQDRRCLARSLPCLLTLLDQGTVPIHLYGRQSMSLSLGSQRSSFDLHQNQKQRATSMICFYKRCTRVNVERKPPRCIHTCCWLPWGVARRKRLPRIFWRRRRNRIGV